MYFFKFDLTRNFVNNKRNSNARRFLNAYALTWYKGWRLKKSFRGSHWLCTQFLTLLKNIVKFDFFPKISIWAQKCCPKCWPPKKHKAKKPVFLALLRKIWPPDLTNKKLTRGKSIDLEYSEKSILHQSQWKKRRRRFS